MNFQQYFKNEMIISRICGAWIHIKSSKFDNFFFLYWAVINISVVIYIKQKIQYILQFDDIYGLVGSTFVLPIALTANIRLYSFFKYRKEFNELMTSLDDEIFQPQDSNELIIYQKMLKFFTFYKHLLYAWSCVTMTGCQMGKFVFGVSGKYVFMYSGVRLG